MKVLAFYILQGVSGDGTPILNRKTVPFSETNEDIVKKEAYNGEYTIEDDGQPESESVETTDDVLNALLGVTV